MLQKQEYRWYNMKMYNPDGSAEVDVHPSKIESMINLGWTEKKKVKAKPKKEAKPVEAVEPEIKLDEESE